MICYRCGFTLSDKNYCTKCGADVGMYKKVLALSNRYYNDALDKCGVRDLSGAIVSLKQSIKLNKNNVDARNLLGLCYYEIGEVVEALGEWVISKSIRDNKNLATDYIDAIQKNPSRLDGMNQNLKKFNQSLQLCYSDSLDYATIQLKTILNSAPKYLKAHQLLALIYIKEQEWEKARIEVDKSLAIDANNTMSLRFKSEIDAMLMPEDIGHSHNKKTKKPQEGVQVYQSGNETIIQPINRKESRAGSILLNIGLGVLIGVAVSYFLILPGKIYNVNEDANAKISVVSDEKDKKTAELDSLTAQYAKLETENSELKAELEKYMGADGSLRTSDALMMATLSYLDAPEDTSSLAGSLELLEGADESGEVKSEAFNALYDKLMSETSSQLATYYYDKGYSSYKNEDFEAAIPDLERAYKYDTTNGDALFYLGNSLRRSGQDNEAKEIYAEVIDFFPNTERASKAETYLAEINNQE